MIRICQLFFSLLLVIFSITANAGVGHDLEHFFNDLGFSDNITDPHAYQGQRAGYYTGGSIYARHQVRNVQLAQVSLPGYRAGCGGIDLYTGSFSFIKGTEIVNTMKSIMSNAAGFAFELALETATPQLSGVMKYLHTMENKINSMNINSCETGVGLVGSLWPKTQIAQQHVCQAVSSGHGVFDDWAASKQGCGKGGKLNDEMEKAQKDPKYRPLVFYRGNLAWRALQKNSFLKNDSELAELFMTLSGTIILNPGKGPDDPVIRQVLPSLANSKNLLNALLRGGKTEIYSCKDTAEDKCLFVKKKTINIATNKALETHVRNLLFDMFDKIKTDQALTKEEKGLIESTSIPIYKIMTVQAAQTNGSSGGVDVTQYSDLIATDIIYQYIHESLEVMHRSTSQLQINPAELDKFERGVHQAKAQIAKSKQSMYVYQRMVEGLINRTQMIETQLNSNLSASVSESLRWANGLRSGSNGS